jgi:exopolysaccharide biosynthesis polyprenyl glycosylphosphotransferase
LTPAELKNRAAEQLRDRATPPARRILPEHKPSLAASMLDGRLWKWLRPLVDAIALGVAILLTIRWPGEPVPSNDIWPLLVFGPVAMGLLYARGMYAERLRGTVLDAVVPVGGALSVAAMALALIDIYAGGSDLEPAVFVHAWVLSMVCVGLGRMALLVARRSARVRGTAGHRTLIVGAGYVGARIARRLEEQPEYGLHPVGFLDSNPLGPELRAETNVPVLGAPADLDWIAQLTRADHIVLAFSAAPDGELVDMVRHCEQLGLEVLLVPRLFDSLNHRASYEPLGGLPLQRLHSVSPRGWQFAVKHALDRLGASVALFLLSPLLLAIAIAVKITSVGPVLFRQERVGRDGKAFHLLKFRSMYSDEPQPGAEPRTQASRASREARFTRPGQVTAPGGVEGADRRTLLGKVLRRLSLDELPQLINVARGQMSLVGPRPERPEFVELFEADIQRYGDRHRVKSGITGWAQVHGLRGQTSLADRVEWDNFYIEHWSLGLDLKVLALTLVAIFRAAE